MISLDLKHSPEDENGERSVLQVAGEATLEHAAELKQALLELFAATGDLSIDCAKTSRIDLAGLQLLCSACRTAIEQNRELTLEVHELPVFQQALTETGFSGLCKELSAAQSQVQPTKESTAC